MNQTWLDCLQQHGGQLETHHMNFDDCDTDCTKIPLSHLGYIRVEGQDAVNFLQGQLSNDIATVTEQKAQYAAYCSHKGRMYAVLTIFRQGETLLLQLPRERVDFVLKRLSMFVLMAKVTLTDVSDELISVGIIGDCDDSALKDEQHCAAIEDGMICYRPSNTKQRTQYIGTVDQIISFWNNSAAIATSTKHWIQAEVSDGNPCVYNASSEAFIPQMLNLQLLDGINFQKGCYTGQEVVARMHYRGKLKRRMYRAKVSSDRCPEVGETLFSSTSKTGQWDGKVVESVKIADNLYELLVVANIAAIEGDGLFLDSTDGQKLTTLALPYSFDNEE